MKPSFDICFKNAANLDDPYVKSLYSFQSLNCNSKDLRLLINMPLTHKIGQILKISFDLLNWSHLRSAIYSFSEITFLLIELHKKGKNVKTLSLFSLCASLKMGKKKKWQKWLICQMTPIKLIMVFYPLTLTKEMGLFWGVRDQVNWLGLGKFLFNSIHNDKKINLENKFFSVFIAIGSVIHL